MIKGRLRALTGPRGGGRRIHRAQRAGIQRNARRTRTVSTASTSLLDAQVYRLSHWKAAADEINYRRFFDINELAAVCMEDPEVFAESHRLVFDLLVRGDVGRAAGRSYRRAVRSDGIPAAIAAGLPGGAGQDSLPAGGGGHRKPAGIPPGPSPGTSIVRRAGHPAAVERNRAGVPAAGDGDDLHRSGQRCRSTWWRKRSSAATRRCPNSGCWPARRATIS